MPALIVTSVDSGTDQLEITGHGLVTGAGPAAVRNIGGALPAGAEEATDYWIIRDDDNHVRLASSSANALAGTAIDLTTNGTGTQLLEIGIPYRRARTYGAGSQLKSADLNAFQDSFKALHALLTGQDQNIWSAEGFQAKALYFTDPVPIVIPGALIATTGHARTVTVSGRIAGVTLDASGLPLTYPIPGLQVGDVITGYEIRLDKSDVGPHAYVSKVVSYDAPTTTEVDESAGDTQSYSGASGPLALGESGLSIEVQSGKQYDLMVVLANIDENDVFLHAVVHVKRPRPA